MSDDLCSSCPHPASPVAPHGADRFYRCRECILKDCRATISKTSEDSGSFMLDDDFPVVNFDSVAECYRKKIGRQLDCPRSVDALYNDQGTLYLIEFKNGSLKDSLKKNLNPRFDERLGINLGQRDALIEKCKDSVLICSDLWGQRAKWFREHCIFVLVYNGAKNEPPSKRISNVVRRKAYFGLSEKLKGFCVKDVLTLTGEEFSRSLLLSWKG